MMKLPIAGLAFAATLLLAGGAAVAAPQGGELLQVQYGGGGYGGGGYEGGYGTYGYKEREHYRPRYNTYEHYERRQPECYWTQRQVYRYNHYGERVVSYERVKVCH